jgi:BirA family biotin operon repressor/biotin-[acetyl-CoA-carboxylase] ligase
MGDALQLDIVHAAIAASMFAGKVKLFSTIGSTNTYAMQQAGQNAPHGSVYVAEEQTAGRGRSDHGWHSEPGAGLYVSILLRPQMIPADALWMSLATGLAVQQAVLDVTGLVTDIRWPNDMMVAGRKFGGILTEMNAEVTRVRHAVIGIGINVNHTRLPEELQGAATSLRMELGDAVSRQDLLIALLLNLQHELSGLLEMRRFAEATQSIMGRLEEKSSWIQGKHVSIQESGGYTGVTAGLDARGFLRVQTADGIRTVLSGGVREMKAGD